MRCSILLAAVLLLPAGAAAKSPLRDIAFRLDDPAARPAPPPRAPAWAPGIEQARLTPPPSTRLVRHDRDARGARRAIVSVDLGSSRLFAFSGKASAGEIDGLAGKLDPVRAATRPIGGRTLGAGVARTIGGIELEGHASFSRLSGDAPDPTSDGMSGKASGAALRAAARLRF